MKVWVVSMCYDYEGCEVKGVFSTEKKAESFEDTLRWGVSSGPKVEEWEIK